MTVKKQLEAIKDEAVRQSALNNMPLACADMKASNLNTAVMICLMYALGDHTKRYWYNILNPLKS